ncbi:MAG: putative toxin-antitoxin system toxin component, PIN family, partial [Euryarchaeota archaeon]|nr:putative toxin-antitoxin system toxin component, PIN family [Euryarchaeota archaeon]
FWMGNPYRILRLAIQGKIRLLISEEIIEEVREVLTREEKFELTEEEIETYCTLLRYHAELVNPSKTLRVITKDPDDNKFLECAVEGKADCIVSGDSHLLELGEYRGIRMLTPAELIKLISER